MDQFLGELECGKIVFEGSGENNRSDIDEGPLRVDIVVFAFDFDSNPILLEYPRCEPHTERLHRVKV